MKKSNKILSLVIALIFMFSAVTPAFAISDEAGDAAATLVGLGVIEGYEDGSLGLDQTITRAEMCVVLAEMADMGAAADILADIPSTFSDVKTGVWYTGYINLAAQQGWVSGYPDGTFKPNAPVSYAEAITMMLNVLGYGEGELPGTWPLNYIVKASNLDITDDVTFSSKAPALRGDVFVMAKAALEADQVNWDKDEDSFVTDEGAGTLLAALTSGETGTVQIDDAYMMVGSSLDDDDREVAVRSSIYEVADGFDIRPYVGIPTNFYLNSDDAIIAVESTDMGDVEMGDTLEFDTCCDDMAFMDDDDDTEYDIAYDAVIVVNEAVYTADGWDEHFYPCEMNFIVDGDDYIIYAEFVDYSDMSSGLVEDVDIDGDDVDIDTYAGSSVSLDLDDDTAMVFGAADELADIEEYDVLYWNTDSDDYAFFVVRDTADGEADRYVNDDYIRVDGDKYYDGENGAYYSLDDASNFDASAEFEDYSEEDVMLFLDGCGDIYAISGDVDPVADLVALAIGGLEKDSSFGEDIYRIDLFLASGEEATLYFESDLVPGSEGDFVGELVEYGMNDDGEIDEFGLFSSDNDAVVTVIDGDDAEDYNRLTAGGSRYYAVSDTVIFYAIDDMDDVELWSWDDIVDAGTVAVDGFVYGDGDRDIEYLVLTSELEGSEADYAVVVDTWSVGSDDFVGYVTLDGYAEDELGEVVDAVYEDAAYAIYFNVSDIDLTELEADNSGWTLVEDAFNDSRSTIMIDGTEYDIDADTLIVDTTDDDAVISASDLGEDVIDAYIDGEGYVEVIVVVD